MINLSYGDRLRLVRLEKGMTKAEMSRHLRISQAYQTRLENGERDMPDHIIRLLELNNPDTIKWFFVLMSALSSDDYMNIIQQDVENTSRTILEILGVEIQEEVEWERRK